MASGFCALGLDHVVAKLVIGNDLVGPALRGLHKLGERRYSGGEIVQFRSEGERTVLAGQTGAMLDAPGDKLQALGESVGIDRPAADCLVESLAFTEHRI